MSDHLILIINDRKLVRVVIQGTWYRNGPGTFQLDSQPMHVFDGHGLVGRVAFADGAAHFACKFVRTPVYEEEVARNKVLFRGFGTTKPGGMLANVFDIRRDALPSSFLLHG